MRRSLIGLGLLLAAAFIWLGTHWPFTEKAVIKALQGRFGNVRIRAFRSTFFPPGGVVDGLELQRTDRADRPALAVAKSVIIRANYGDILTFRNHIDSIHAIGLHVTVPQTNAAGPGQPPTNQMPATGKGSKSMSIGEVRTENAVLEFLSDSGANGSYVIQVHQLTLHRVNSKDPIPFEVLLHNPAPPGEIRANGLFGPWKDHSPGETQVSGSYAYERANLGIWGGISGTLNSSGSFRGKLSQIMAEGAVDVPDFEVSGSSHKMHVACDYRAEINGANGDTSLTYVSSRLGRTTILSRGSIKGGSGEHGKTVMLSMNADDGRIEDLLNLFSSSPMPAETGRVRFGLRIELPPGPAAFLRRLRLDGAFGIDAGHFTRSKMQLPLNRLAESARGESKKQEERNGETVLSDFNGRVSAKDGIAELKQISFREPGSEARIDGQYNLVDKRLDLRGVLQTTGKLSDTKSGFKSLL